MLCVLRKHAEQVLQFCAEVRIKTLHYSSSTLAVLQIAKTWHDHACKNQQTPDIASLQTYIVISNDSWSVCSRRPTMSKVARSCNIASHGQFQAATQKWGTQAGLQSRLNMAKGRNIVPQHHEVTPWLGLTPEKPSKADSWHTLTYIFG